ncbi:hypothetical protein UFOVP449_81 [uncultured Caudovirales phage]|uniref:Uncharacterized protein n=1 Tax=uncultured Caudovirales phage TaxID=2100421 RepID=A0A6J5M9N6_9CAUD|nr:hypothetical protein UFOVP449_81 [uncultured Caudovirales phage]
MLSKILYSIFILILPLITLAQNGGQSNENSVLKINYIGYSGSYFLFKIENKQNCAVRIQYTHSGNTRMLDTTIEALSVFLYKIPSTFSEKFIAKARSRSFCPNELPDQGWVEAETISSTLPVTFMGIFVKKINHNTLNVKFKVDEDNTIKFYRVLISIDGGKKYINKIILFPNGMEGKKLYEVNIKL